MKDTKELKKWREYYKNQWLKTGRDVYKKKHKDLERQIQVIEVPEGNFLYEPSFELEHDSNLKSGMTGTVDPNMKVGKHKILSIEKHNEMLELIEGLKIDIPANKKSCISIDCREIISGHELKEVVTSYLEKFDKVKVELANGHRVYESGGVGGMILTEEEVLKVGSVWHP